MYEFYEQQLKHLASGLIKLSDKRAQTYGHLKEAQINDEAVLAEKISKKIRKLSAQIDWFDAEIEICNEACDKSLIAEINFIHATNGDADRLRELYFVADERCLCVDEETDTELEQ